ncbi:Uncharacterised protein [Staphylococcus aureus]|nr:Uncharacterised protein [Staphylococcus aureus]
MANAASQLTGLAPVVNKCAGASKQFIISLRPTIADIGIPPAKDFPKVIKSGVKLKCETELHVPVRPKPC